MRYWKYQAPEMDSYTGKDRSVSYFYSDQNILDEYYNYWCDQMKRVGKEAEISEENCIDDWVTSHWAWLLGEKPEGELPIRESI